MRKVFSFTLIQSGLISKLRDTIAEKFWAPRSTLQVPLESRERWKRIFKVEIAIPEPFDSGRPS